MPTYNQADYIGSAIQSVLSQSYQHFELIIVDNFSTDGTEHIVAQFADPRIKYVKFNNKGVIAAGRNHGVTLAIGDVIAFLDSDDIWLPEMLSGQLPLLTEDVCLVSSCFKPIGNSIRCRNHLSHIGAGDVARIGYKQVINGNPVMTSSVVLSKQAFQQAGGFDEGDDFRFIEDWELWLRLSVTRDILINGNPLLEYRISSKTDRDLRDVKLRTLKIIEKNLEMGFINTCEVERLRGNCYVDIGKAHLDMNDRNGIYFYKKSLPLSNGMKNKVRAIAGLLLFCIPGGLRHKTMNVLYSLNSMLSR